MIPGHILSVRFSSSWNVSNSTSLCCFPYYLFYTVAIYIWFTCSFLFQIELYYLYRIFYDPLWLVFLMKSLFLHFQMKACNRQWYKLIETMKTVEMVFNRMTPLLFLPYTEKLPLRLRIHYRWDMLEKCKDTLHWSLYIVIVNLSHCSKNPQLMYIVFFTFHFHWNMFALLIIFALIFRTSNVLKCAFKFSYCNNL